MGPQQLSDDLASATEIITDSSRCPRPNDTPKPQVTPSHHYFAETRRPETALYRCAYSSNRIFGHPDVILDKSVEPVDSTVAEQILLIHVTVLCECMAR